ncbi:MAG: PhzF family phenazine biosynthesis protein, partial [Anaerolineae bacterium]|nr:PhzF family phenazine biosynthesis protein [Anaerolineae bacterium]
LDHKKQEPAIINALCEALDPIEKCTYLVMVFSTEATREGVHVHARAFAPGLGIAEDPATGSANGGMGAYLVKHGVFSDFADGKITIISEQGVEMGRPSNITIEVIGSADEIQMVRVGGSVVPLMQGTMTW